MTNVNEKQIKKTNANPDLALYYLLHTNPVYQYITDEENINIMILGAGDWALRFIGIALQTCQVVGRSVTITVACEEPGKTAEEYLKIRPAVPEFVNVRLFDKNGSSVTIKGLVENKEKEDLGDTEKEMYGTLNFVPGFFISSEREDAEVINNLFSKFEKPQYVFIDLVKDDDNRNYNVAHTFAKAIAGINIEEQLQETIQTEGKKLQQITKKWSRANNGRSNKNRLRITNRNSLHQEIEAFDFQNKKFDFINYVITGKKESDESVKGGKPVFVNQEISKKELDPLDQMAFNAHLSWYNTLNIDQNKEQKKFREDTYNYNSSLAFVLSIPYKLWSVNINYNNTDISKAAADFQELLDRYSIGQSSADYLKLIQLEHRRWVLEKICDIEKLTEDGVARGWKGLKIDDEFVAGCIERCSVKDKKEKIHQCLVRSTVEMPLKEEFYSKGPQGHWNEATEDDDKLDELDRMSIDLHRKFYEKAQDVLKNKPIEDETSDICKLEKLLFGEKNDVIRAFNRYRYCIINILAGNEAYSKQFESIEADFEKALTNVQYEKKQRILGDKERKDEGLLKAIHKMIFPVIESNLYRDYKSLDEDLVKNIPFILTYKQVQDLFLVFDDGLKEYGRRNNNAVFQNVASATVLNPKRITYLYYFDNASEETVISRFTTVVEYLYKRIEGCKVNLAIVFRKHSDKKWEKDETDIFINKINDRIKGKFKIGFKTKACKDKKEAVVFFEQVLKSTKKAIYDATTEVFNSDNDDFNKMQKEVLPWFKFSNFKDKHFTDVNRCDFLRYIEKGAVINKTCLRIEDVFSLMNAKNKKYYTPDFFDVYRKLWEIYTGNLFAETWETGVRNWTALCNKLSNYVNDVDDKKDKSDKSDKKRIDRDKNDIEIKLVKLDKTKTKNIKYAFPEEFHQNVQAFCDKLVALNILRKKPSIRKGEAIITMDNDLLDENLFKKIFKNAAEYFTGGWLTANRAARPEEEMLIVSYNNLEVKNLKVNPKMKRILDKLSEIKIDRFSETKCIEYNDPTTVNAAKDTVSFKFGSETIKKLLCKAGEILEIYTYYEILKTGYFDDAVCSYEFQWESGVENELDCVVTKGFKSIIIECKARGELEPEFYHKLANISNVIGIAEKSVLLANTYKKNDKLNEKNQKLIENGNLMGVITISKQEDIKQIGQKLCEIIATKKGGITYV